MWNCWRAWFYNAWLFSEVKVHLLEQQEHHHFLLEGSIASSWYLELWAKKNLYCVKVQGPRGWFSPPPYFPRKLEVLEQTAEDIFGSTGNRVCYNIIYIVTKEMGFLEGAGQGCRGSWDNLGRGELGVNILKAKPAFGCTAGQEVWKEI